MKLIYNTVWQKIKEMKKKNKKGLIKALIIYSIFFSVIS